MVRDWPLGLLAWTVSVYWLCVGVMVARSWIKFGKPAGALPRTRGERAIWLVWTPTIAGWIIVPWIARHPWGGAAWFGADGGVSLAVGALRGLSAAAAVVVAGTIVVCMRGMGANWSLAVMPKKKTTLLTSGAFELVRHPIYALSLLLMALTVVVVGTWPIGLVAAVHAAMIVLKARSEERHLRGLHGQAYAEYCRRTNRFLPRLRRTMDSGWRMADGGSRITDDGGWHAVK
jgi:protein-S-isoprenylcysteine O-methyltransferase Ste14